MSKTRNFQVNNMTAANPTTGSILGLDKHSRQSESRPLSQSGMKASFLHPNDQLQRMINDINR